MKGNIEVAITKIATKAARFAATTATISEKREMVRLFTDAANAIDQQIAADRIALIGATNESHREGGYHV